MHLVPEPLGDDRVGQLDVGGHARRLARRQSHGLDLGEEEAELHTSCIMNNEKGIYFDHHVNVIMSSHVVILAGRGR